MSKNDLIYEKRDNIALITLDRPEKRNAFSDDMIDSLIQALEKAGRDDRVKGIVVTGSGKAFCGGGDIGDMINGRLKSWGLKDYLWDRLQRIPLVMEKTDKLLVAAINGSAAGGGFDLASPPAASEILRDIG